MTAGMAGGHDCRSCDRNFFCRMVLTEGPPVHIEEAPRRNILPGEGNRLWSRAAQIPGFPSGQYCGRVVLCPRIPQQAASEPPIARGRINAEVGFLM